MIKSSTGTGTARERDGTEPVTEERPVPTNGQVALLPFLGRRFRIHGILFLLHVSPSRQRGADSWARLAALFRERHFARPLDRRALPRRPHRGRPQCGLASAPVRWRQPLEEHVEGRGRRNRDRGPASNCRNGGWRSRPRSQWPQSTQIAALGLVRRLPDGRKQ